jgi:DNA excision repair protein ERCC-4
MARLSKPLPRIVVDTREQTPFVFDVPTMRGTLNAGDYSLEGLEKMVAVERKSHGDMWGSMSNGRARFERCVQRLALLDRAAIVVECSLTELCCRPRQIQRVTPASVVGGLISWSAQYSIPVFFCDNREYAARVTLRFLASYLKHRGDSNAIRQ